MEVGFLKWYVVFVGVLALMYAVRHYVFTINRLVGEQRLYYHDIIDSDLPSVTVLLPMHNEEAVARGLLDALVNADYPREKLEVIPVNDHSDDGTGTILEEYASKYPWIRPLHRTGGRRGKPAALNDALRLASGEVVMVFDADYLPPRGILRDLALAFLDPEVGAVMGRVVPVNSSKNLLTRLLELERMGGYQVDQQARFNLGLIPQYGGTVGGFRKNVVLSSGGFNEDVLAEDTELTFRLFVNGWKVVYANREECYEEAPETWKIRARQLRRWSAGHNQVLFRYFFPVLFSRHLNIWQKVDGLLLLGVYLFPTLVLGGLGSSLTLFLAGETSVWGFIPMFFFP